MSQQLIPPRNIQIDETHNNVRIVRKWLDKTFFSYLLPLAIGWNGFFACGIWILFISGNITFSSGMLTSNMPVFANIIIILFILMGIYLIYLVIVKLINRTEIIANDEEIAISHRPLFYLGLKRKRFRVSNLKDFHVKQVYNPGTIPSQYYCYEVYANTHTGSDQKLLTVASSKEAYFIETTLVEYYKIELEPENETEHEPINARSLQSKEKQPVVSSVNKPNEIESPKSIKIYQDDTQIKISKKWTGGAFMAGFAILWNGIFIVLALLFANSDNTTGNPSLLFPYFLVFFSTGLLLIYVAVMLWRNYTYIVANEELITVSYGSVPCPWFRNQQIKATQLKRLYSKVYSRGKNGYTYIIHAKMTWKRKKNREIEERLVSVDSRQEALFIERTLEDYYNIEDQPQEGEIGGPERSVLRRFLGNQ
ncbi:MAG: hypothetical protein RI580_02795 [Halothece sp. Uz-M2-17]|nr:hypothetical protein [Halothece sp. Uz-M2-17]